MGYDEKELVHLHSACDKLCDEIVELCEDGIDSWSDVEKLHILLKVYGLFDEHIEKAEDEEDEEAYEYVAEQLFHIIKDHPMTWDAYIGTPDGHMDIIEMELGEMEKAYKGMRADPPTVRHQSFVREMKHTAAALIAAIAAMECPEKR